VQKSQDKEIKGKQVGKGEVKLFQVTGNIITYVKNCKAYTHKNKNTTHEILRNTFNKLYVRPV